MAFSYKDLHTDKERRRAAERAARNAAIAAHQALLWNTAGLETFGPVLVALNSSGLDSAKPGDSDAMVIDLRDRIRV